MKTSKQVTLVVTYDDETPDSFAFDVSTINPDTKEEIPCTVRDSLNIINAVAQGAYNAVVSDPDATDHLKTCIKLDIIRHASVWNQLKGDQTK